MKVAVVAVVGSKKSGKTTVMEALTRELTRRGHKIAAIKHISEPDFTIDTAGKDTWRFAQAGAKTIVAVASNEIATIEKTGTKQSLKELLVRCKGNDIVLLEGFKKLVAKNNKIRKIVTVKSAEEARKALEDFAHILAFSGFYAPTKLPKQIPYVDALKNVERLADIVEKAV
ncbi:MAG: molybdopterin-guanine dinucleotide biosynthesis protein B [Candidatus Bathyarchaeia archaeon]